MATSVNDGSQTAVISTEHTLDTISASGSFVIGVDTNAMALGDELILRVKSKIRSAGTTRTAYQANYIHNQTIPAKFSIPVVSTNEIVFTLEQVAGTGRAFLWEIWSL